MHASTEQSQRPSSATTASDTSLLLNPRPSSAAAKATAQVHVSNEDPHLHPDITSYAMAYHLSQMYPQLYQQAMASARAKPAPNYTLVSDWGETLKQ